LRRTNALISIESIAKRILNVRGLRVMLDVDLAQLYGVSTKRLNEQVKRNSERFPSDFMLRLTSAEAAAVNRSQFATGSSKHRDPRALPFAFSEHGCLMLANVLKSRRAAEVSVLVVRAFIRLREVLAANKRLADHVDELARQLGRHGRKLQSHEGAILKLLQEIQRLTRLPARKSRPIGFTADLNG